MPSFTTPWRMTCELSRLVIHWPFLENKETRIPLALNQDLLEVPKDEGIITCSAVSVSYRFAVGCGR